MISHSQILFASLARSAKNIEFPHEDVEEPTIFLGPLINPALEEIETELESLEIYYLKLLRKAKSAEDKNKLDSVKKTIGLIRKKIKEKKKKE